MTDNVCEFLMRVTADQDAFLAASLIEEWCF